MGVRRAARRHHAELGALVAVHSGRPGAGTLLTFGGVWLLFSGLTLIRPAESLGLILAAPIAFALIAMVIWVMISGERLAICERGLLAGSVAPGLRPYVLRFDELVPGSLVPVTGARRFSREVGAQVESTARISWWSDGAVYLVGPSAAQARRGGGRVARLLDPPPRTIDRRWTWIVGVTSDPRVVVSQIAAAAGASGCTALAEQAEVAPLRELTGRPEDAARQLPGLHPLGRR